MTVALQYIFMVSVVCGVIFVKAVTLFIGTVFLKNGHLHIFLTVCIPRLRTAKLVKEAWHLCWNDLYTRSAF